MLRNTVEINEYKNRDPSLPAHPENQYLNLLNDILQEGTWENGRNGRVKTAFGSALFFSLEDNKIPILTTKKMAYKTCLKELLWFIKGDTDNNHLNEQGVHIWDGNTTREFLDSRGLNHYAENDIGSLYGFSWRFYNAKYDGCDKDYTGKGIDQLQNVINMLKDPAQRTSRRMVVTAWNPEQLDGGCLPPCHVIFQFNVTEGNKLSCAMMQRSADCGCGVPFNIASYAFLTCLIAKHCDLEPYEFVHYMNNCHIYEEHIEPLQEQVKRDPLPFPTLTILNKRENISDYTMEDFLIEDYQHHGPIKLKMVA